MYNPVSTYRLQFNKAFTFADAKEQVEYYHLLGVGTIYASPVFTATPESMHGYDVTNPNQVNPELGGENQLSSLFVSIKKKGIGWLQDIVPNHMAYNQHNPWIWDVWEKGEKSVYAGFFDIDWNHPGFRNRLMVPFLGKPLDQVLLSGELSLQWIEHGLCIVYFDQCYPLRFETYLQLLNLHMAHLPRELAKMIDDLSCKNDQPEAGFLNGEWESVKLQLKILAKKNSEIKDFMVSLAIETSADLQLISSLAKQQHYLLSYWKETEKEINYRRFFTVNDLICLKMNNKEVFDHYHETIRSWFQNRCMDGLRVDHVDGLYNPNEYLDRLRDISGKNSYQVVEKILESGENLTERWDVQGTSGYDFLALVNNLFTYKKHIGRLKTFYDHITGLSQNTSDIIDEAKSFVLRQRMSGEWDNLTNWVLNSGLLEGNVFDQPDHKLIREAIGAFLIELPVYRIYTGDAPLKGKEKRIITDVFRSAMAKHPELKPAFSLMEPLFLSVMGGDELKHHLATDFFRRCMQLSGPLMAKGVEDTTMYRYNAFISHNEVGDAPDAEGISVKIFHEKMKFRQKYWPLTMNATSTHDTKRGEDVRARLNVISELPDEWEKCVAEWMRMNKGYKTELNGKEVPSVSEEYFIYQTMTGVMPFNQKVTEFFISRLDEYMVKALREAKLNTNWSTPDEEWELSVLEFIHHILDSQHGFLNSFLLFQEKISGWGVFNSLSQLALKATSPGVPDFYQGTEMWDLSLVDPDNRRPVDYDLRHILLRSMIDRQMRDPEIFLESLFTERENGSIKLWLTHRLLQLRRENQLLFSDGTYLPLNVTGKYKNHILAFARCNGLSWHITIVPLFLSSICGIDQLELPGQINWKDTTVEFPDDAPVVWHCIFSGLRLTLNGDVPVAEVFRYSPVGLLHAKKPGDVREAGVLMHISSLPGKYGVGDFGHEAYKFVDFLTNSGHRYWQILPLNQVIKEDCWSPYSSVSAFAGNVLFISPEVLAGEGLLHRDELVQWQRKSTDEADYDHARLIREEITSKAWFTFRQKGLEKPMEKFREFCERESFWLHDYSLFILFKELFNGKPWNQWPEEIVLRQAEILEQYSAEYKERLDLEKFRQYLFNHQWKALKRHANYHGIKIIGDLPIYVGYDNADVWSHSHLFKLHADKTPYAIAGVPPDYFSETGQLWNMPVFDWDAMKKENYLWWVSRIEKNIELFDIVRLDHFRGFEAYWEVLAGEPTAVNGRWIKGPGDELFSILKKKFPEMPFIAEDLGEIDAAVYDLRDAFGLPGMKVLQFSFDEDMPFSIHIPHNHLRNSVVYTGTHDSNTTRGWFKNNLSDEGKKRLQYYTGIKPSVKNCHEILNRLAWSAPARLAIIPMQDILGLGPGNQMNIPSTTEGNWLWRLKSLPDDKDLIENIKFGLWVFGRSE